MTRKQKILAGALVLTIGGSSLFLAKQSFAATGSSVPSIVQELATKFGLKPADVQAVFDQHHDEMQAQRQVRFQTSLDADVSAGKLTMAQEQLILSEVKQWEVQRENDLANFKTMTPAQRRATLVAEKEKVDAWATENGIDPKYLHTGRLGIGRGRGWGGGSDLQNGKPEQPQE